MYRYLYWFVANTAVYILRDEGEKRTKNDQEFTNTPQYSVYRGMNYIGRRHQSLFFLIFNANNKINKYQEDIVQLYIKRQIPLHIISFQGLSLSQFSTHKSHVTIIFPTFATNIYYYMYIRLYIIGCNIMETLCNICFYYHQMQNVTTSMPHNKSSWWDMTISWSMKFNTITD